MISNQYGPYGAPPQQPQHRPTDGVSVAALVTGVLGLALVPLVLGIVGLTRTAGGRLAGRGLAVAGLVLGAVQTLLYTGLVIALAVGGWAAFQQGFSEGWNEAGDDYAATDGPTSVYGAEDLVAGDCLVEDGGLTGSDIEVVDCATAHDAEVLHVATTTYTEYPGEDAMSAESDDTCYAALDAQITAAGLTWDQLWYGWYTPSADTWGTGDREIDCLLYPDGAESLTGSLTEGTLVVNGPGTQL